MKKWIKPVAMLVILGTLIYAARGIGIDKHIVTIQEWVKDQGSLAPVVYVVIYVLTTILALPGSAITIMAGALFGSVVGTLVVVVGSNLGVALCFLISRHFARDFVLQLLSKNEKFQKLDQLTEKNGYAIVAITRLVPLFPFNLLNYGFGLTKVPFKVYCLWSAICMLPGTILYVVGAHAISGAIRDGQIPWSLVFIIVSIIIILFFVIKKAKASLKE